MERKNNTVATIRFGLFLGIVLLSLSFISAYETHKQNTDYLLIISSNNATSCNVTYVGNSTNLKLNMTRMGQDFSRLIAKENFSVMEDTCMGVTCYDGVRYETGSVCLTVNYGGYNLGLSESIIMMIVILILVAISSVTLYTGVKMKWSNTRDDDGYFNYVNYSKYAKLLFLGLFYFEIVLLMYLASGLLVNFSSIPNLYKMFYNFFLILYRGIFIIIFVIIALGIVSFIKDKRIEKAITRNLRVR